MMITEIIFGLASFAIVGFLVCVFAIIGIKIRNALGVVKKSKSKPENS